MKLLIFLASLLIVSDENKVVGEYYNHFGQTLRINQDSTFACYWNYHMTGSWTKGKWEIKNDTIYFKVIPVFDTVRFVGKKDSIILSIDEKPELITEKNASIVHLLSTHKQSGREMDLKLFYKDHKLFAIDRNGKLMTKKQRFSGSKKYNPWFIRK